MTETKIIKAKIEHFSNSARELSELPFFAENAAAHKSVEAIRLEINHLLCLLPQE